MSTEIESFNKSYADIHATLGIEAVDKDIVFSLKLVRMLVKGQFDSLMDRRIQTAVLGLLLSGQEVTKEKVRWLLRDASIGFDDKCELRGENGEPISLKTLLPDLQ